MNCVRLHSFPDDMVRHFELSVFEKMFKPAPEGT